MGPGSKGKLPPQHGRNGHLFDSAAQCSLGAKMQGDNGVTQCLEARGARCLLSVADGRFQWFTKGF